MDLELAYINKTLTTIADNLSDLVSIADTLDNIETRLADIENAINNLTDTIDGKQF